ncbi:hypothetical protein [Aquisediminimonas sediminicola]|uniref:hypothetical protein n=1 Tax=Alteraquisediminimonas sediminicola TaxID=2676787 RepID=UPI001C8D9E7C|nr:hypothetical protein [Aquisediminimonas sediminicola]
MDAFEQLAAEILWNEGYWVQTCVKVELGREDKERIRRPSSPRWEIDLVAYHPAKNELLALECKSYLDSGGVHAAHFGSGSRYAHRYKLFHDDVLRETILRCLNTQFVERGLCLPDATVRLGLIYAHATPYNTALLARHFDDNDWILWGPDWLRAKLNRFASGKYDNSIAAVVAKVLLRGADDMIQGTPAEGQAALSS